MARQFIVELYKSKVAVLDVVKGLSITLCKICSIPAVNVEAVTVAPVLLKLHP